MNMPAGWPTEEMIRAGYEAYQTANTDHSGAYRSPIKEAFDAMIAAAPTPPAQGAWNHLVKGGARKELEKDSDELRKKVKIDAAILATHPQSDELRKIIEETVEILERYHEAGMVSKLLAFVDP